MKTYEYQVVETIHQMTEDGKRGWHFIRQLPWDGPGAGGFLMEKATYGLELESLRNEEEEHRTAMYWANEYMKLRDDLGHLIKEVKSVNYTDSHWLLKALIEVAEGTYKRK